jgi:hypothetical protein
MRDRAVTTTVIAADGTTKDSFFSSLNAKNKVVSFFGPAYDEI